MAPQSVFFQSCPVCGRSLRMPVNCFGRQVTCVHCGGEFHAGDDNRPADNRPADLSPALLPNLPLAPDYAEQGGALAALPLARGSLASTPRAVR
jgi:hypothetical protein